MVAKDQRKPIIHLLSVAATCEDMLPALDCANTRALIALIQEAVGDAYRVTATASQIEAVEDEDRGGRIDDEARAREIQKMFANDDIVAGVALRGGAWLTRILPRIDFDVLAKRHRPLALFGFSELTPLLNIAAMYPKVVAYHDLCPGYLIHGMTHYARQHIAKLAPGRQFDAVAADAFARGWAAGGFRTEFTRFFEDVVRIIDGRGSTRTLTAEFVRGKPKTGQTITVVGGNLTALITLLGSPFADALQPKGRWLLIEDVRETPARVDRMLSHLSLPGWLQRYEGILLGDFHDRAGDRTDAVLACLDRHLGKMRPPLLVTHDVGHVWPISPLPIGRPFELVPEPHLRASARVTARIPWSRWRTA